jgi:sugar phosphate isomerase/epimerase
VLDSWHWYTAEEDIVALQSLTKNDVVAVDLNDAPAGIPVAEQIDNRRELPMATGVIDTKSFLAALISMGYDGPVRAEPFNQELNKLDDSAAVKETATAMKRAFALA